MPRTVLFEQRTGRVSTRSDGENVNETSEAAIMAQSARMAVTSGAPPALQTVRAPLRRAAAALAVAVLAFVMLAPLAARAADDDRATAAADDAPPADDRAGEKTERSDSRQRAERALRGRGDDDDGGAGAMGLGSMLGGRSGMFGTALLAAAFYFFFMRGRGGNSAGASWGSYYLFWIVAPAILAAISSHPEFLVVIVIGLVARRWLPDPFMFLKHRARVRSLQIDIDTNPSNATARRDLAKIWLEKHRPRRALPLLDQAIARDPNSVELVFLSGISHLLAGQHEQAVEALVAVTHRQPNYLYGEAYLRAADALAALGRWDDADDALERYVKFNSSSVEGRFKRARVCKARKDGDGARRALADLKDVWRSLPSYQRRKQFGWYIRSLFV
jgi:tetratricopeptide (TPR) repeat protein